MECPQLRLTMDMEPPKPQLNPTDPQRPHLYLTEDPFQCHCRSMSNLDPSLFPRDPHPRNQHIGPHPREGHPHPRDQHTGPHPHPRRDHPHQSHLTSHPHPNLSTNQHPHHPSTSPSQNHPHPSTRNHHHHHPSTSLKSLSLNTSPGHPHQSPNTNPKSLNTSHPHHHPSKWLNTPRQPNLSTVPHPANPHQSAPMRLGLNPRVICPRSLAWM